MLIKIFLESPILLVVANFLYGNEYKCRDMGPCILLLIPIIIC